MKQLLLASLLLACSLTVQAQIAPIQAILTPVQATTIRTKVLTYASTKNIDVRFAGLQTMTVTGNLTLNSTNRPTQSDLSNRTTLLLTASGGARTIAFNAGWAIFGTNTTFSLASGKKAFVVILATGSTEASVVTAYDQAQ